MNKCKKKKKRKKKTSQFNFYRNEVFKEAVKTKLTHHILHLRKYFLFYPIRAGIKKKVKDDIRAHDDREDWVKQCSDLSKS